MRIFQPANYGRSCETSRAGFKLRHPRKRPLARGGVIASNTQIVGQLRNNRETPIPAKRAPKSNRPGRVAVGIAEAAAASMLVVPYR